MDLWIRSQDKERLMQVNNFDLFCDEEIEQNDEYRIYTYIDENRQYLLGTYKTKERALEVLDEIQNEMIYNEPMVRIITSIDDEFKRKETLGTVHKNKKCIIYEMPKE